MSQGFLYPYTGLVTVLALMVYVAFAMRVGNARVKYAVMAPAVTGHPDFERRFRVQYNTLEQLALLLPALWLCALTVGDLQAGIGGLVWCFGRIVYAFTYQADPRRRFLGFVLTVLPSLTMLFASAWALLRNISITY
ncbi:MAG: MAPEG family protein [Alphaproteobacteria bacterium]